MPASWSLLSQACSPEITANVTETFSIGFVLVKVNFVLNQMILCKIEIILCTIYKSYSRADTYCFRPPGNIVWLVGVNHKVCFFPLEMRVTTFSIPIFHLIFSIQVL